MKINEGIDCRCGECGELHREFIQKFGKWPSMTHIEGQDLKRKREENEASWDVMQRFLNS